MKKLIPLFLLFTSCLYAQENYTISGIVKDQNSGETIYGATIFLNGTSIGALSNEYGFYSISAPKGTYDLSISFIGYTGISQNIILNKNQKIDFEINEELEKLDEIVIESTESESVNIRTPQMSVTRVQMASIKRMPVVMGEIDIIKSIQLLPGITNNGKAPADLM